MRPDASIEVADSPNSAGVAVDAIRSAKIAIDRKIRGAVVPASAFLMKHPPEQMHDEAVFASLVAFAQNAPTQS